MHTRVLLHRAQSATKERGGAKANVTTLSPGSEIIRLHSHCAEAPRGHKTYEISFSHPQTELLVHELALSFPSPSFPLLQRAGANNTRLKGTCGTQSGTAQRYSLHCGTSRIKRTCILLNRALTKRVHTITHVLQTKTPESRSNVCPRVVCWC